MAIGIFSYLFGPKSISESGIRNFLEDKQTKRICFSRIQTSALWKTKNGEDMITVPFGESIGPMLKEQTGVALRKSRNGKYYNRLSQYEYEKVKLFVDTYSSVVFLRDLLDVSIALSLNFESDGETHTHIGLLEKSAKYDNDLGALHQLAAIVDDFMAKTPLYANAAFICAVPPTRPGEKNLPIRVSEELTRFNGSNVSSSLVWTTKTESLKNADGADKLEILQHSGLTIAEGLDFVGKDVVLLDDLYMSGITLQYVAMKLKEAGAGKVYGLCLVKSLSNG
ncbi:MAG: hypothetical protein ACI4TU_07185 [Candidatus Cryptobacteroides sp.]